MKKVWFKAKRYGYGWYPATWQGWLIILIYVGLIIADFRRIDAVQHSGSDTLINWVPDSVLLTILLLVICVKTGEKAKWRWGGKD
jgi:hypothetical protein